MNTWPQPTPTSPIPGPTFPIAATLSASPELMSRKRILIVDDSVIVLKTLSMKLKSSGYDVLTATDGAAAVSTARRERPDLILLDISFPPDVGHGGGVPWDGFLIMNWLHRMEEAKGIPIIIITSSEPSKYKERSMAAGAIGYFQKPINNEELLVCIRQTLGQTDPQPAA